MTKDKQRIHSAITYLDYLAVTCFFISGFTSLVYEICWIRKASLVFGATTLAVSSVIAIFFLGSALGSYTFGRYTQKTVTPLKIYAVLEIDRMWQREYEKAIEYFSQAIINNPDNKSALKNQEKARQKLQMMLETMK